MVTSEFILANSKKIPQLWRIDFFVFCGNQQCCDTKEMKLALLNLLSAQILVKDELSDVEAFRDQSEFTMDVNDPFQ